MCRQGEKAEFVYIVREGEFEQTTLKKLDQDEGRISYQKSQSLLKQKSSLHKKVVHLSLLGTGMLFGDDDILASRTYSGTLKCYSSKGQLVVLHKTNFLSIFKSQNEQWNVEFAMCQKREKQQIG